jgi:hypothetical protein
MKDLIRKILREDFDWTKEVKPMSMGNLYVIDVRRIYIGDFRYLLEDLKELGYDGTEEVPLDACYVYMNYDDGYFSVEWDACNQNNPTYGGDYQMINIERFDEMYYHWKIERDKGVIGESEFDWTEDIKSPVDIALEITDQTVVTPGAFMEHPMIEVPFSDLQYSEPKYFPRFHFDNYINKHYSEDPIVIDDVWKRWNQEIY